MVWKPPLVVLFCTFCAAGSGAMAGEDAQALDAVAVAVLKSQPVGMPAPGDDSSGAFELSAFDIDFSPAGPFALSDAERLQLREQIRKAAQDIYSERDVPATRSEVTRAAVTVSP